MDEMRKRGRHLVQYFCRWNDFLKLVLKLAKAVHHMTLFWNEYISFATVSHSCFRQGIYTI